MREFRISRDLVLPVLLVLMVGLVSGCALLGSQDAAKEPAVDEVRLCSVLDGNQQCATAADVFPPGETIYCSVKVSSLKPGTQVTAKWYREGGEVSSYGLPVEQGGSGSVGFHLASGDSGVQGSYKVQIYLNQDMVKEVPFRVQGQAVGVQPTVEVSAPTAPPAPTPVPVVEPTKAAEPTAAIVPDTPAPEPTSPPPTHTPIPVVEATPTTPPRRPVFGDVTFAQDVTVDGKPVDAAQTFSEGITKIYGIFDYEGMEDGRAYTHVWMHEGGDSLSNDEVWSGGRQGQGWWVRLEKDDGIVPGGYTLQLYVEGELIQEGVFTVEAAAAPLPPPTATPVPPPTAAPVGFGPPRGRIVYTVGITDRKNYEVWIMNADGSGQKLLSKLSGEPTFSPDGKRVSFYGWEGKSGGNGFWIMNSDGGEQRVWVNDVNAAYPTWSPKGGMIAFTSYRGGGSFDIYIKRLDDEHEWKVVDGKHQDWAPDESRLVINSCTGSDCGLFLVNIDGGGLQRFTTETSDDFASWSPDGRRIVFCSQRAGNWEVHVMNADGGGIQRLTNDPGHDVMPVWLPTGNHIAWRSTRGGSWGIWVMDVDGGNQHKIADVRTTEHWGWEKMDAGW